MSCILFSAQGPLLGHVDYLRRLAVVLVMMWHLEGTEGTSVYFNNYAHCNQKEAFSLQEDKFTVEAFSATGSIHETLYCELTFKSPPDTGVCLTFNKLHIVDCGVTLHIYQRSSASGKEWRKLSCDDGKPSTMCTSERYVTLKLAKRNLNENMNYDLNILVEKGSNLSGQDVILASSIGLFAGIIVGVVVLIVTLAVIVLCCCCKPCETQRPPGYTPTQVVTDVATQNHHVQPTAPPASELASDEHTPLQSGSLYPSLPQPYPLYRTPEAPPPYAPPPYEHHLQTDSYPTKV